MTTALPNSEGTNRLESTPGLWSRISRMSPEQRSALLLQAKPRIVDPYIPHVPHPTQQVYLSLNHEREVFFGGAAGGGKLCHTETPMLTTAGWKTMGTVEAGDYVFDHEGQPTEVLAVSATETEPCYALRWSTGETIIAGERHRWVVQDDQKRQQTQGWNPWDFTHTVESRHLAHYASYDVNFTIPAPHGEVKLESIVPTPMVEMRCIQVANPRGIYLVGDTLIPTHNSDSLLMAALSYVDVPGYAALILRKTFKDLTLPGAIMDRCNDWLTPTPAHRRNGGQLWEFPTGPGLQPATLSFGHLMYHSSTEQYRSAEFQFIGVDELTQFEERCVDEQTEILTRRGWLSCDEVRVGDEAVGLGADGIAQWTRVHDVSIYPARRRQLLAMEHRTHSSLTTLDHRWYARRPGLRAPIEVVLSSAFIGDARDGRRDSAPVGNDWRIPVAAPMSDLPTVEKYEDDLVELMAWFTTEGHWASRDVLAISQSPIANPSHTERIEALLGRMLGPGAVNAGRGRTHGCAWSVTTGPTNVYRVLDIEVRRLVASLVDREKVADPEFLASLTQRQLALFVEVSLLGDGCGQAFIQKHDGRRAAFEMACALAGLATSTSWRADGTTKTAVSHRRYAHTSATVRQVVEHDGRVWCPSTGTQNFLARRAGTTYFTGNTYEFMFSRIRRPALPCENCPRQVEMVPTGWRHKDLVAGGVRVRTCEHPTPKRSAIRQYQPSQMDGKTTLFDVPLRMRSASNPGGIGHSWVRDRFVDPRTKRPGCRFVPSKLTDNPSLDQESYREALSHMGRKTRLQLEEGLWDVVNEDAMLKSEWFEAVEDYPREGIRYCRYWDLAATAPAPGKNPDWTVGALLGLVEGVWYLIDLRRTQARPADVERLVVATAQQDCDRVGGSIGRVRIRMEQEPGSAGVNTIATYRKLLVGYDFDGDRPTGPKEERARPLAVAAENKNFKILRAAWNRAFLDEAEAFPDGPHDDQVDGVTGAMKTLVPPGKARLIV
jgi:predicted phage terminase large subunit-like protein